jgi:hypothetical protein
MEGEKMRSHQKEFLNLKCISPLKMLTYHLFEETFGAFLFIFFLFLSPLFSALSLEDLGVLMTFEEKIICSKLLFNWLQYTGRGRIFWSGVIHANMAKP